MAQCAASLGAQYEIAVAADLMRQHFEVFRNLSPAGSIDLIIRKLQTPHVLLRVQVKSGSYSNVYLRDADVLAVFNPKTRTIRYRVMHERLVSLFHAATLSKERGRNSIARIAATRQRTNGFNVPDYSPATTPEAQ